MPRRDSASLLLEKSKRKRQRQGRKKQSKLDRAAAQRRG